jgi:hypothetical protein
MRGRPPGTGTAPGTCQTCGRAKTWKADSRRATGGYWTCSHGVGPSSSSRQSRSRPSSSSSSSCSTPRPEGTQRWLEAATVRACKAEGCFWDASTCPEHPRKTGAA